MSARRSRRCRAVVAVGGLDPSCGAGIAADVRTLADFDVLPAAVATAVTVQSGSGLELSEALRPGLVAAQLEEILDTWPVAAVKLGQIPTPACARAVASCLAGRGLPLVVDPVIEASGGGLLASPRAVAGVKRCIFPITSVLTANLSEAAALSGMVVDDEESMAAAAAVIAGLGPRAVLVKGGHLRGEVVDILWTPRGVWRFAASRLAPGGRGRSGAVAGAAGMHGSGCALASALAASLARGQSLRPAVESARAYVRAWLADSLRVGARPVLRSPRPHPVAG